MTPKHANIAALDGVRGMLALWVMLGHSVELCGVHVPILTSPGVAVHVFMLMSGFLMAYHYAGEQWERPSAWRKFYLRRAFRIMPIYWLALFVAFAFHQHLITTRYELTVRFALPEVRYPAIPPPFGWGSLLLHMSGLFGFFRHQAANNILPDWSIGLEWQFYLFFPLIMLFYRSLGALFVASATPIVVLGSYLIPPYPQPTLLPFMLMPFVVGILMGDSARNAEIGRQRLLLTAALALSLTPLLFTSRDIHYPFVVFPLALAFLLNIGGEWKALGFGLVTKPISEILGSKPLKWLGDRSYGIYLLHMLALVPLVTAFATLGWYPALPASIKAVVVSVSIFGLTAGLSAVAFATIEKPLHNLGRRLTAGLAGGAASPHQRVYDGIKQHEMPKVARVAVTRLRETESDEV